MKNTTYYCSFVLSFIFGCCCNPYKSIAQKELPAEFCITQDEHTLYNHINEYRGTFNLSAIPLSKSLCYVAKMHVKDLIENKPDSGYCNFHSWSDKGGWTPCCFQKIPDDNSCMHLKPTEITNYAGSAFEIVFWESIDATPESAFNQWRETSVSRSMLINGEEWEKFTWNAIGVSIQGSFAAIWLGEELDIEKETKICGRNVVIANEPQNNPNEPEIISSATDRFYLIFGSFNSINDAKAEARKYIDEGFKKTKIISNDNKFRISLSDYSTKDLANQGKKELPAKYRDAWIMQF